MDKIELFKKCIVKTPDGILMKVMVTPNSKTQGIEGVDEWRGCLKVRVAAQAHKGMANRELMEILSSSLDVQPSDISIRSGETSKIKEVEIRRLTDRELINRLIK
jgi:uncharacterized protein (TIGR00251 family)